jgi:Pyruvate/2-oxoacid:ferredoxin oxidoreductase delta subunit
VLKAQAQAMMNQLSALTHRITELEATGTEGSAAGARMVPTVTQAQNRFARMTAIIDKEKCTCCGLCVDICPEQAISMNDAVTVDSNKCTGCSSCVNECPNEAISMSDATQRAAL